MKAGWSRVFRGHSGVSTQRESIVEPSMSQPGMVYLQVRGAPGEVMGLHISRSEARKLAAHVLKCAGIRSYKAVLP